MAESAVVFRLVERHPLPWGFAMNFTYYPAWIAVDGQIHRGPDCTSSSDGVSIVADKIANREARLGTVVRVHADDSQELLEACVQPPEAQRVVREWNERWNSLEKLRRDAP